MEYLSSNGLFKKYISFYDFHESMNAIDSVQSRLNSKGVVLFFK